MPGRARRIGGQLGWVVLSGIVLLGGAGTAAGRDRVATPAPAGPHDAAAPRTAPAPPTSSRRPPVAAAPRGPEPAARPGDAGAVVVTTGPPATPASVWATAHFLYADFLGTCVACTSTGAGADRSSAEARGARILTEEASEGQGPANGYSSGALIILPSNPLLHLAVDSWSASTRAGAAASDGHADAALLDLGLAQPGALDVTAGHASSDSASSPSGAAGSTAVDGLTMTLGGGAVHLVVLHSERSNRHGGRVFLVSLNGISLLESGGMAPGVPITVLRVASLHLLHGTADGADAAAARDGRSQGVVGVSSGWTGAGAANQPEPLQ